MAYTTEQLTVLEAAIASGQLSVRYADRQVTYQTLQDMQNLRQVMLREISATNGTGHTQPRHMLADFSDG